MRRPGLFRSGMSIENVMAINNISGSYDPLAAAFFTAANITDTTQKTAVNNLCLDLRSATYGNLLTNVFSGMPLWPIVGGSAASHKVNLLNPGTFDLTFFGSVTHSANGMVSDGSTGYAKTGFVPSVNQTTNNNGISVYSRTNNTTNGFDFSSRAGNSSFIGTFSGGNISTIEGVGLGGGVMRSDGFFTLSSNSVVDHKHYRNGSQIVSSSSSTVGLPTGEYYLMASNESGSAGVFANRQIAFACPHLKVTAQQAADLYTIVQNYQTALSRQI